MRIHAVLLALFVSAASCAAGGFEDNAPLAGAALERVKSAATLLGLVEHFHPSDEASGADWIALGADLLERAEQAEDAEALATTMREVLGPIAPTMRLWTEDDTPASPAFVRAGEAPIVAVLLWRHHGYGPERAQGLYRRSRFALAANDASKLGPIPMPSQPMTFELGAGVSALLPVTVWLDSNAKTLPRSEADAEAPAPRAGLDRPTRMVAAGRLWSALQHFAPFAEPGSTGLESMLERALRDAAEAADESDFRAAIERMLAELPDGRAELMGPGIDRSHQPPAAFGFASGGVAVFSDSPDGSVRAGDEILSISGADAMDAVAKEAEFVSGVEGGSRERRALERLTRGPRGSELVLEVRGADGSVREVTLARSELAASLLTAKPARMAELAPGIHYIDPSRFEGAELMETLRALQGARGVVFDYRGLSSDGLSQALGLLIGGRDVGYRRAEIILPQPQLPNRQVVGGRNASGLIIGLEPRVDVEAVFLIDSGTSGDAESDLALVQSAGLGKLVGQTSAGAIGEPVTVTLPAGYSARFIGVAAFDGIREPINGRGFEPDVHVDHTLEGLRAGRDEALAEALRLLLTAPASDQR